MAKTKTDKEKQMEEYFDKKLEEITSREEMLFEQRNPMGDKTIDEALDEWETADSSKVHSSYT